MADPDDRTPHVVHDIEHAIVAKIRNGDVEAFGDLVRQYANRLIQFARHMVGSEDVAEDIVQSVFVHLWDQRASLKPGSLKSYLFAAVRNRSLNERRSEHVRHRHWKSVQEETSPGGELVVTPSPERYILTSATLHHAIEQLSERRRLAIRLRIDEEMTNAEIAEVLGLSPVAARQLIARAIADLRDILSDGL